MGLFNGRFPSLVLRGGPEGFGFWSIGTRLLMWLIPAVVCILGISGLFSYRVSCSFIDLVLERNVRVQTLAISHQVEQLFSKCREDILFISQGGVSADVLRDFVARNRSAGGVDYREAGFVSSDGGGHFVIVSRNGDMSVAEDGEFGSIRPNPLLTFDEAEGIRPGEVRISRIIEIEYPFVGPEGAQQRVSTHILRFFTPCVGPEGREGLLFVGLDVRHVRNILSLYNSDKSPLWGYPRSSEVRFAYLFDNDGWMLCQSEELEKKETALSTYLARAGMEGTLGRPGLSCAFRPSSGNKFFWGMVFENRSGQSGIIREENRGHHTSSVNDYYLAWAPLFYAPVAGGERHVVGGIAFEDRSVLTVAAGYKHLDVMFIITIVSALLLAAVIIGVSHCLTRPIMQLARTVDRMHDEGEIREIAVKTSGYEAERLRDAFNRMIAIMRRQIEEIRRRDETIRDVSLREKAALDDEVPAVLAEDDVIPEIIGIGPEIEQLKSDIVRAAQVDVDVLVVGETGTGKQLAAEAVHRHSPRRTKPFISINCGALDENLLLDTLFGHVRGAFTEARTDRKGAFQEAHGGTLFLDEIQSASPKVQQSLLRAIAMRKIKPLGSDREVDVNVRLIAATNADLPEEIREGRFREDLYFRLKVIMLSTPPLRRHRESIPALAQHYLHKAEAVAGRKGLALSKGALEKLREYDWPGNIRELVNVITRAAVMSTRSVIQAEDIRLEDEDDRIRTRGWAEIESAWTGADESLPEEPFGLPSPSQSETEASSASVASSSDRAPAGWGASADSARPEPPASPKPAAPRRPSRAQAEPIEVGDELNIRQQRAIEVIRRRGEITRSGYQKLVGGDLPSRTAIYDLQDLVKKGLLKKTGKGPATKYVSV
ncbi:DNA-binding NtrC family response regulator [Desulfobaculum xiamenense]|uniref:DNA-binding NtrC family response regulator n=1 Tax=Desulfobaculum xiamenense TaxID=995050 RepID=A0A846QIS0_9BACT|nr:sigma-54 dependent transcriptional regulator [Desulfobaculum xiamenense]NJB68061.1 DNA-binding NtrC family response regulator [Desulfobaculum xiamenense]